MTSEISHDRAEETVEAKARWFQSLTLTERMELLCAFTDLILSLNPGAAEADDAEPAAGAIRIIAQP